MASVDRKLFPVALIAVVTAATVVALRSAPPMVTVDLRGLLPFALEPSGDVGARWVLIVGMPLLALLVWAGFQLGRARAGLRLARLLFPDAADALGDPATIERFRGTYDTVALWVVVLILGFHAGMVAAALGHHGLAPRLIAVTFGVSIAAVGNVFPRLRPNLVAGVRTRRTLADPQLWRATHRILGLALVVAGIGAIVVGLVAPAYGLVTAVGALVGAGVVAAIGGARSQGSVFVAGFMALSLLAPAMPVTAQQPATTPPPEAAPPPVTARPVELPVPAGVAEEQFVFRRAGVALDGTLARPRNHEGAIPVVLIVAGSGPTDRNANGPLLNSNAYALLAWGLAEAGFASVRYDKRGIGASQRAAGAGDPTTLTTDDYVADVVEGANVLAADPRFARVVLLGHSEGAGHVLQAANRGAPATAVVLVAPQGRKLAALLHDQFARLTDSATLVRIDSAFARYVRGDDPGDVPPIASPIMVPTYRRFMQSFAAYDPEAEVRQLRLPLLIVQGTMDIQVSMQDAERLMAAQPSATLARIQGANHVLKTVDTTDPTVQMASYRDPNTSLAPGVMEAIVTWLGKP